MGRLKERTPELRSRVLRVAVALLDDGGVVGFTARRVAAGAQTSTPAVYELFGDKAGLIREMFFEGFGRLADRIEALRSSERPRADLEDVVATVRAFVVENPVLAEVMFSRPFADFDPGPGEFWAGRRVREHIVGRVRRCLDAGVLVGDATDVAHVLLALAQGLSAQESAGRLGTSRASIDRRWSLAVRSTLDGMAPAAPAP
jgi:AcrR family transcriptional regulator